MSDKLPLDRDWVHADIYGPLPLVSDVEEYVEATSSMDCPTCSGRMKVEETVDRNGLAFVGGLHAYNSTEYLLSVSLVCPSCGNVRHLSLEYVSAWLRRRDG